MSDPTPLVTASRDALAEEIAGWLDPTRTIFKPVIWTELADYLLASGVVRAMDELAVDEALVERAGLALRRSRLTWGTHADRWTDIDWQREFWNEAALTALAAALATPTDPSEDEK